MESIRKCLTIVVLILVLGFIVYRTDVLKCNKNLIKSYGSVSNLYDSNPEYNNNLDKIKKTIENNTKLEVTSSFINTNDLRLNITKNMNNITKNIKDDDLIPKNIDFNDYIVKNNNTPALNIKPQSEPTNGSKIKNFNNNITNLSDWFLNDNVNLKSVSTPDDWHN